MAESPTSTWPAVADGPGLLQSMWRHRLLVVVLTLLGAGVGLGLWAIQGERYVATTELLMTDPREGGLFRPVGGGDPERHLQNEIQRINTDEVVARAAELSGSALALDELRDSFTVMPASNRDVLRIRASAGDAQTAVTLANGIATAYADVRREGEVAEARRTIAVLERQTATLQEEVDTLTSQLGEPPYSAEETVMVSARDALVGRIESLRALGQQLRIDATLFGSNVEQVTLADEAVPAAGTPVRDMTLGGLLGLLLGALLAWWRTENAPTVLMPNEAEAALSAPVLGEVTIPSWPQAGLGTDQGVRSLEPVLGSLTFALAQQPDGMVLLVTSPQPTRARPYVSLNLTVAAIDDGRRAILVEADPTPGDLSTYLLPDARRHPGLSDVAAGRSSVDAAMHQIWLSRSPTSLGFIPGGTADDLHDGLVSTELKAAVRELRKRSSLVVIDAPACSQGSDVAGLAQVVDAVVLVVTRGLPLAALEDARRRLALSGTPVLGQVFVTNDPPPRRWPSPTP